MDSIILEDEFKVIGGTSSSPKGNKTKYFKDGYWYKSDPLFREQLVTELLSASNVLDYVSYESVIVNGSNYCKSATAWDNEITFDKIFRVQKGAYANDVIFGYRDIEDRFKCVVDTVYDYADIDVSGYIKTLLYLDMLIGNYDRHFNNMGLSYNQSSRTYEPLPIFDNGDCLNPERMYDCANFGGRHEYVLSCLGRLESPIQFDYSKIECRNKLLEDNLQKYKSVYSIY